jgi:hypothetical protein
MLKNAYSVELSLIFDIRDLGSLRHTLEGTRSDSLVPFLFVLWDILVLPVLENFREIVHTLGGEQANVIDQGAESTSRVCSTRETKEKYLVSRLIVGAQEPITFSSML